MLPLNGRIPRIKNVPYYISENSFWRLFFTLNLNRFIFNSFCTNKGPIFEMFFRGKRGLKF